MVYAKGASMKKLIVLLMALVAMPAFAGTKAYTKNGEGGQIVLTLSLIHI